MFSKSSVMTIACRVDRKKQNHIAEVKDDEK